MVAFIIVVYVIAGIAVGFLAMTALYDSVQYSSSDVTVPTLVVAGLLWPITVIVMAGVGVRDLYRIVRRAEK